MAPVVEAYQAMRGASFLVAVTFAAEIGDVRRFDTPRQLTSFLGLVPAESSTGDTIRRKGLTLAGNRRARRALVEAAWTYRYPARVSETLRARLEGLPKPVRDIAWKAQVRLCARYRRLSATGKKPPVVVAAIAREMAAFLWAIGREVAPAYRMLSSRCADPGAEHERWRIPVASYVAGPCARRPSSRPRKAETKTRKAVTNPRIRVQSTVVSRTFPRLAAAVVSLLGSFRPSHWLIGGVCGRKSLAANFRFQGWGSPNVHGARF